MRLLLDPAAEGAGGGAAATPTPTPTATPTPTPAPTDPAGIIVNPEDYKKLLDAQSKLAEFEVQKERELNEAKQREIDAHVKKGEAETALTKQKELSDAEIKKVNAKAETLETQLLADRRSAEITAAMLGTDFVSPAAAEQARKLLDERIETIRDAAGTVTSREKGTLKPAATVIKDWLASPESAHFRKASTTGGAGATGADQPAPTDPDKPQTVSEALIAREKARLAAPSNSHYGLTWRPPAK